MKVNQPVTGRERTFSESERIISTTDPKGIITGYNQTFFDISGFEKEELDGKNHNTVRHPDMPPEAFADLWQTIKGGSSWMGIVKNRCKNGDHYWVDAFVTPITENGQVVEYQSVRIKPSAERVERAEKVYKRINDKKKPFGKSISFINKLYLTIVATILPMLAAAFAAPELLPAAAVISLLLGCGLIFQFSAPLRKMAVETEQIVNNPLMRHIYTGRNDELGQIELYNKMVASRLDAVVSRIDFATDEMTHTISNTANISEQAKDSLQIQQDAIQEIASSIIEMSGAIQEVAQNARDTAKTAKDADGETVRGQESIRATLKDIETLNKEVVATSEVINRLGEESDAISGVLDVIREIAEQTNMLALNAAIEAARAGEQGRGFAVVADEVRTLAVRTQDSIAEIENIIQRVQDSAKEATVAMQDSCDKANHSSQKTEELSTFLNDISQSIASINSMTDHIACATEQQICSSKEINQEVITLSSQADRSVVIGNESESVSKDLSALSTQLKKLVRQFK